MVKCLKFLEQPGACWLKRRVSGVTQVDQLAQELDLCTQVFEGSMNLERKRAYGRPGCSSQLGWRLRLLHAVCCQVEASYSYTEDGLEPSNESDFRPRGLQLEARAADTSALSGSLASVWASSVLRNPMARWTALWKWSEMRRKNARTAFATGFLCVSRSLEGVGEARGRDASVAAAAETAPAHTGHVGHSVRCSAMFGRPLRHVMGGVRRWFQARKKMVLASAHEP